MNQAKDKAGRRFRLLDALFLAMTLAPPLLGMALRVLTNPASEDIDISGANVFFTLKMPLMDLPITESQVNGLLVILSVLGLCLYMTHGIAAGKGRKRYLLAEWVVEKTDGLVRENMGPYFAAFSPFVGAILALSACSSLMTLIGLYPPTSDLNVVAGWAILVMILITHYKLKAGFGHYLKSFGDPFPAMAPLNIISEIATPISMSFRHYGKRALGHGHFGAGGRGSAGPVGGGAGLAPGRAGADSAAPDRPSGGAVGVL